MGVSGVGKEVFRGVGLAETLRSIGSKVGLSLLQTEPVYKRTKIHKIVRIQLIADHLSVS
jgi:hypothetical protein